MLSQITIYSELDGKVINSSIHTNKDYICLIISPSLSPPVPGYHYKVRFRVGYLDFDLQVNLSYCISVTPFLYVTYLFLVVKIKVCQHICVLVNVSAIMFIFSPFIRSKACIMTFDFLSSIQSKMLIEKAMIIIVLSKTHK